MESLLLPLLIFAAAVLYSSVGHAGASGYLAAMALFGLAPESMKPAALLLNILVATIGTIRFAQVDCVPWRKITPFVATSIPAAFLGGWMKLPGHLYQTIVGVILVLAAINLLVKTARGSLDESTRRAPLWAMLFAGLGLGFLAGLTGTGGGIFLSPLLLFMHWAGTRETAGISVAFILCNSVAGLTGNYLGMQHLPEGVWLWLVAAGIGGMIGATLGSRRLMPPAIRYVLAVVLLIAAAKLILT